MTFAKKSKSYLKWSVILMVCLPSYFTYSHEDSSQKIILSENCNIMVEVDDTPIEKFVEQEDFTLANFKKREVDNSLRQMAISLLKKKGFNVKIFRNKHDESIPMDVMNDRLEEIMKEHDSHYMWASWTNLDGATFAGLMYGELAFTRKFKYVLSGINDENEPIMKSTYTKSLNIYLNEYSDIDETSINSDEHPFMIYIADMFEKFMEDLSNNFSQYTKGKMDFNVDSTHSTNSESSFDSNNSRDIDEGLAAMFLLSSNEYFSQEKYKRELKRHLKSVIPECRIINKKENYLSKMMKYIPIKK